MSLLNQNSRKEQEKRSNRIIVGGLILAAILILAIVFLLVFGDFGKKEKDAAGSSSETTNTVSEEDDQESESQEPSATEEPTEEPTPTQEPVQISAEGLNSDFALLLRLSDDKILLDKAGTEKMYPASMTKIMTALVAIENLPDLDEEITVTAEEINPVYEMGASLAGFNAGETVTVRDLLYGVLLPSGAEACAAIADRVAGSQEAYVEMMNQKAAELGMENTHFVTDSGLHDPDHYTTCYDIAKLLEYAIQNETFRTIFTAHTYTTTATDYHPQGIDLHSTTFAQLDTDQLENGGVIQGGKTGFEDAAGRCLASLAEIDGEEYILVTGHAPDGDQALNIADALYIYNQL